MTRQFTGYIEGYYGKLLQWEERAHLLNAVASAGMTSYFYAPKEDDRHRQFWRKPYDPAWNHAFGKFTDIARAINVQVIAGIAPGLDFEFSSLTHAHDASSDFTILLKKARQFVACGADFIALMMDDIAADFDLRAGSFKSEGEAHAILTNKLGEALDVPVIVVPRIYADCLITFDDLQSIAYLKDLVSNLDPHRKVVYCGEEIIAKLPNHDDSGYLDPTKVILWDNFYANDYCPRRLFLGPWRVVSHPNVMLNLTGMVQTDLLLINLMVVAQNRGGRGLPGGKEAWCEVISNAGVPDAFFDIAYYFDAPHGFDSSFDMPSQEDALTALELLLWRWKSPLQREWYSSMMGLKQDILMADAQLPFERIKKTQLWPLTIQLGASGIK